eukprot:12815228-Heterocapsa_arctica.AAC.1
MYTTCVPKHTKLTNLRPDTFAEYDEKVQWHNKRDTPPEEGLKTTPLFDTPVDINTGDITMLELDDAVRNFNNNKAPGPSGVPIEAIKRLDKTSKFVCLHLLNNCLNSGKVSRDMNKADLA